MTEDFSITTTSFLIGMIISFFIVTGVSSCYEKKLQQKVIERAIEKNKITYEKGNIIYLDKDLKYILKGE